MRHRNISRGCVRGLLIYESSSGFGGSANALTNLVSGLNKNKFKLVVVLRNFGSFTYDLGSSEVIKLKPILFKIKTYYDLIFYFFTSVLSDSILFLWLIRKKRIKLLHCNNDIISGMPAILGALLAGVPCVCHIRQTRKFTRIERFFAGFVSKFLVVNNNILEDLKIIGISRDKVRVVYDGIDLNKLNVLANNGIRDELKVGSFPLVGLIGRVVEGKGHKEFIYAAKEVIRNNDKIRFVIVGDAKGGENKYFDDIKEIVEKENLTENVIFAGWRNDIDKIIADLDILVQATTTFPEGFGLTCIEAMAQKKPVIATNVPGPSDIVVDRVTGFLVPPGDIKAMADKIIYLLDNPDIAKKMGEAGRIRCEEVFNIKNTIKQIDNIYEELLRK